MSADDQVRKSRILAAIQGHLGEIYEAAECSDVGQSTTARQVQRRIEDLDEAFAAFLQRC